MSRGRCNRSVLVLSGQDASAGDRGGADDVGGGRGEGEPGNLHSPLRVAVGGRVGVRGVTGEPAEHVGERGVGRTGRGRCGCLLSGRGQGGHDGLEGLTVRRADEGGQQALVDRGAAGDDGEQEGDDLVVADAALGAAELGGIVRIRPTAR